MSWAAVAVAGEPGFVDAVALHLGVDGRVVEQQTLQERYEAACEAGSELACKWRSWDDFGRPKLSDLARLVETPCEKGEVQACVALAWTVGLSADGAWDAPRAPDPTRAAVLMRAGCEADIPWACVELGRLHELGYALPVEPDEARARYAEACEAGLGSACLRRAALADEPEPWREKAAEHGAPAALPPAEACEAGVVEACEAELEAAEGEARVALLERLCRMDDAHCMALLEARAGGDPGPRDDLPERSPDRAWAHEGGVLVGWRGTTWGPHRYYGPDDIAQVRVLVTGPRHEVVRVELASDGDEAPVLQLPGEDCETAVPQVQALAETHRVRVVDAGGLPMASDCLDAIPLGERPEYFAGTLVVDAENTDFVREAQALREQAAQHSDALYACGDAVDRDAVLDALELDLLVKRGGQVKKAKLARSSGDAGFDQCVQDWLLELPPVDGIDLTTRLQLTTRLLW